MAVEIEEVVVEPRAEGSELSRSAGDGGQPGAPDPLLALKICRELERLAACDLRRRAD